MGLLIWMMILASFPLSCRREPGKKDVLVIGDYLDVQPLTPLDYPIEGIFPSISELVWEGLTTIGKDNGVSNRLAEKIQSGGKTLRITLKKGLRFSDGTPLLAGDVIFTVRECMKTKGNDNCRAFDNIEKIQEIGDREIIMHLKDSITGFSNFFASIGIIPRHLFKDGIYMREVLLENPVGAGPYMIESVGENTLVLKANPHYHLKEPEVKKIVFRKIENKKKAWALLISKQIDMLPNPTESELELTRNIPYLKLYEFLFPFNYIMLFNNQKSIFRDRTVKKALNLSVDRDRLVREVLNGMGTASEGLFHPRMKFYPGTGSALAYDPQLAKNLLAGSGWLDVDSDGILEKKGRKLAFTVYYINDEPEMFRVLIFIKEELLKIGIRLEVESLSFEDFMRNTLTKRNFETILYPCPLRGGPGLLYDSWHSKGIASGFNWAGYDNTEADRLFDNGRAESSNEKRTRIYSMLHEVMQEDPPGIYLYWKETGVIVNSRFKNIDENASSVFDDIPNWTVN